MMKTTDIIRPVGFRPGEISARINEEVVQQHAEEAPFLWLLRRTAVTSSDYSLKDLADLDERLEAHIDGLRACGGYGWQVCEEQLGFEEPGEVFTAGVLAIESEDNHRIQKVMSVALSQKGLWEAFTSASGWVARECFKSKMQEWLHSDQQEYRRFVIAAAALHRMDPGTPLIQAIHDADPGLRARACKTAGELGRVDLTADLLQNTIDNDPDSRFYAAWSAARLGVHNEDVIAVLGDFVVLAAQRAEQALGMIIYCMPPDKALRLYNKLKSKPACLRLAVIAAGMIGYPILIPDLIAFMHQDMIARVAGEAFTMITGFDIEYEDLDRDAPEKDQNAPTEEPDDEVVDLDPDEALPWPDPARITAWWDIHRKDFRSGTCYLRGQEIHAESLKTSLCFGNQRQRAAAALRMAVGNPRSPLFEVRAPGKRQMHLLNL